MNVAPRCVAVALAVMLIASGELAIGPLSAQDKTVRVSTSGNDATADGSPQRPFQSIQKAIDAAAEGDTVAVAPGTYPGPLTLKSGLTLLGSGSAATVISGEKRGVAVRAAGVRNTAIKRFRIRNGVSAGEAGGLLIVDSSDVIVEQNAIVGNTTDGHKEQSSGGGIRVVNSSVQVRGNHIKSNFARISGGGLELNLTEQAAVVEDNIIESNTAHSDGGGIKATLGQAAGAQIRDNRLVGNAAGNGGGGVAIIGSGTAAVVGNTMRGNRTFLAGNGGAGVHAAGDAGKSLRLTIAHNVFNGNLAAGVGQSGGAMLLGNGLGPQTQVINNTVVSNQAGQAGGLAVYYGGAAGLPGSDPTIANNIIWGNTGQAGDIAGVKQSGGETAPIGANFNLIGSGALQGTGNRSGDPRFVDPAGDFHLRADSPAINAGDLHLVPAWLGADIDGKPRIQHGAVDMGVDEYGDPFASISDHAALELGSGKSDDRLVASGAFVLGPGGAKINPTAEPVIVKIGKSRWDIPPGGFQPVRNGDRTMFRFDGKIGDTPVRMRIVPEADGRFRFKLIARHLALDDVGEPLQLDLAVGDDYGATSVRLDIS